MLLGIGDLIMFFVPKTNDVLIFYKQNIVGLLFFDPKRPHSYNSVVYAHRKHASVPNRPEKRPNRPEKPQPIGKPVQPTGSSSPERIKKEETKKNLCPAR